MARGSSWHGTEMCGIVKRDGNGLTSETAIRITKKFLSTARINRMNVA